MRVGRPRFRREAPYVSWTEGNEVFMYSREQGNSNASLTEPVAICRAEDLPGTRVLVATVPETVDSQKTPVGTTTEQETTGYVDDWFGNGFVFGGCDADSQFFEW